MSRAWQKTAEETASTDDQFSLDLPVDVGDGVKRIRQEEAKARAELKEYHHARSQGKSIGLTARSYVPQLEADDLADELGM